MDIPFNSNCFNQMVRVKNSGETGKITGFSKNMRHKEKQFLVEYVAADGRFTESWFYEDQIEAL